MMKHILKSLKREVVSDVSWDKIMRHNPRVSTTPAEAKEMATQLPLVSEDMAYISSDGEPLAVFLKKGLFRPWKQEKKEERRQLVTSAVDDLRHDFPAPAPKSRNSRHIDHFKERKISTHPVARTVSIISACGELKGTVKPIPPFQEMFYIMANISMRQLTFSRE